MSSMSREVRRWRDGLLLAGTMSPDDVEELVGHLRDSMEELQSVGLSESEAFLVARRRLGSEDELRQEFRKVRPGWSVGVAFASYVLLATVIELASNTGAAAAAGLGHRIDPVWLLITGVATVLGLFGIVVLVVNRGAGWWAPLGRRLKSSRLAAVIGGFTFLMLVVGSSTLSAMCRGLAMRELPADTALEVFFANGLTARVVPVVVVLIALWMANRRRTVALESA